MLQLIVPQLIFSRCASKILSLSLKFSSRLAKAFDEYLRMPFRKERQQFLEKHNKKLSDVNENTPIELRAITLRWTTS